jgi:hypothetical protein
MRIYTPFLIKVTGTVWGTVWKKKKNRRGREERREKKERKSLFPLRSAAT